ncbi:hypothetical protein ACT6NV_07310 [Robiginitalea sp. IMCC44478]|uniref:hypothetical protein n=1 Tax=Robiginitalea sp. IMCC44478 TaxID=3459122 RepID=UPI0040416099
MRATSRKRKFPQLCRVIGGATLLFAALNLQAQSQPEISTSVDTTSIRIGEQIRFTVRVETDSSSVVFFPEGQTFSPLETVEAFMTDTTRKADRILLEKTYALTQFDSGAYLLPTQRIEVDGKGYFTDSLLISVATVPVDTVTQKMYDIKPLIGVDRDPLSWLRTLGWVLLVLLLAGIAVYWFFIRKKPLSPEEEEALLPPFERAMRELKRLETSRYLIQDEFKQYYTELTDIVRSYLEEEVHVSALESTTSELILKLELLKDAGQLRLEPDTLIQFRKILETADLVKFAKSKPEVSRAEQDRLVVESIVVKTKEAIPEPTEEELMQQAEYLAALKIQKKRKKIRLAFASLAGILLVALISSIAYFGFANVKDTLLGNPSKSLLEGEWVASSYGYPPVILETPEVLYRRDVNLPPEAREAVKEIDAFIYNNPDAKLSIAASSTLFNKTDAEPDFEGSIEQILKGFEEKGARNIITKQETFTTVSGVKGIKIYGRGDFPVPESSSRVDGAYTILMFGGNGFLQELVISWEEGDPYAEEIVDRILKTIEVKTTV